MTRKQDDENVPHKHNLSQLPTTTITNTTSSHPQKLYHLPAHVVDIILSFLPLNCPTAKSALNQQETNQ